MMFGLSYHVESQENSAKKIYRMYEKEYILTEIKWKKKKYPKSENMDRLPRRNKSHCSNRQFWS